MNGLRIIGESINDSVPSTHQLFESNDLEGLKALAVLQDQKGATYIDVNVGKRPASFMAEMVKAVQSVTTKPLSIDTPDPELAEAGLRAYDIGRAGGALPIINSISPLRIEMFDLLKIRPFIPILLVSERFDNGRAIANKTPEETHRTACEMVKKLRASAVKGVGECIIDPGIAPVGSDLEGYTKTTLGSMRLIHEDPDLAGVHMSVGLSNFTVMLPPKRPDGSPVKGALESAFLTRAMPLGLDMIVGSVNRKYAILADDHPAMRCLDDLLKLDGYDVIMRVQEFYTT